VPAAVLNYIPKKQGKIWSLSITTDVTCLDVRHNVYDPFRFTQLRHIAWKGDSLTEAKARGEILWRNAQLLEEVEVDLIDPDETEVTLATPINQLAHRYLKLKPGEQSTLFHSLRKLTLSNVCFKYGLEEIAAAFNFFQLRSLKLQNCLDTNPLLDMLASSSQSMRLTSLELNYTGHWDEQDDLKPLARFLKSFKGLEDLYISVPTFGNLTGQHWGSVLHHGPTLKRVVHQQVGVPIDLGDIQLGDKPIGALLTQCNLNCLGVGCRLHNLVRPCSVDISPKLTSSLSLEVFVSGSV
jgi:hypothetical protein